jgi:hypothetical protein
MVPVNEFRKRDKEPRPVKELTKWIGPMKKLTLKSISTSERRFVSEEGTVET